MEFPDWRSIGRRLRGRLDDIIDPSPRNPSPSPSERLARRKEDAALKGFVYFDNFDEVEAWSPGDVDPIHVPNIPLLPRPTSLLVEDYPRSKVLLCHDYKGGYNEYESTRPVESQHEDYSCTYLQYVDTFIYFSHKLVCCPPAPWIHVCHRNGVKILGTFIVEPQTPDIQRMLEHANGSYWLASQLKAIAEAYAFDGWLLNVEKCFPKDAPGRDSIAELTLFIQYLRQELGNSKMLIWYDALTCDNKVKYQNGLTEKNLEFAKAAGALFTNYRWTEKDAGAAIELAQTSGMKIEDIYFGVDMWAQNSGMKRVTYGGGGTRTGLALETLAPLGLSTAIFAPGWTREHFQCSQSTEVETCTWEGGSLPSPLLCSCNPETPHDIGFSSRVDNPITRFANEYPSGSDTYFFSNFQGPFVAANGKIKSVLGIQSILPKRFASPRWELENEDGISSQPFLYGEHDLESSSFSIWLKSPTTGTADMGVAPAVNLDLELFQVSMRTSEQPPYRICLHYVPHKEILLDRIQLCLVVKYSDPLWEGPVYQYRPLHLEANGSRYIEVDQSNGRAHSYFWSLQPQNSTPNTRLTAISIRCSFDEVFNQPHSPDPQRLVTLEELFILPSAYNFPSPRISNIHVISMNMPPNTHQRLAWDWQDFPVLYSHDVPWSATTGPFSHFRVFANDRHLGDAWATQFVLHDGDLKEDIGEERYKGFIKITIVGFLFAGGSRRWAQLVGSDTMIADHEDWVHV